MNYERGKKPWLKADDLNRLSCGLWLIWSRGKGSLNAAPGVRKLQPTDCKLKIGFIFLNS